MLKYNQIKKAHVELSSYCNASCPACPRNVDGGYETPNFNHRSLGFTDFQQIFSIDLLKQLESLMICGDYGDPMMSKDILDTLKYIASSNKELKISIRTNGGVRTSEFWESLGILNATHLPKLRVIFGIDGLEDTNHLYRIGVDFNKVISNAKSFINSGGQACWDFLVFKHNQHQVNDAKQLAQELGFVEFKDILPHSFDYNGKMRVIDRSGNFIRTLERSDMYDQSIENTIDLYDDIEFNFSPEEAKKKTIRIYKEALDSSNELHSFIMDRLSSKDDVVIEHCMCKDFQEIYIDSSGGVHPCCFMGHISQEHLEIHECVIHKKWIEDNIGINNINALRRPIKEIIDSDYFSKIEQSWKLTFEQGRNPLCVLKCGIQRPNNFIRVE